MRVVDRRTRVSRRGFLTAGGAATAGLVALSVSTGMVASPSGAWAVSVVNLKPETMRTLIQIARDIYPHDHLADRFYAAAVSGYDEQAGKDPVVLTMIEDGVAELDALAAAEFDRHYAELGWEAERVALLHRIEDGTLFQTLRSGLVVGLYNNPEVWPKFGFEGASAEQGGYLHRGFDDIDWV